MASMQILSQYGMSLRYNDVTLTECVYSGSCNVMFLYVKISLDWIVKGIKQYIISNTKMITKTLPVSNAVQGIKAKLLAPLLKLRLRNRFTNFTILIGKGNYLFKRICHNLL